MLVVYLNSGERREVPKAIRARIVGDRLICVGKEGEPIALFSAIEVYMCSRKLMAAVPA